MGNISSIETLIDSEYGDTGESVTGEYRMGYGSSSSPSRQEGKMNIPPSPGDRFPHGSRQESPISHHYGYVWRPLLHRLHDFLRTVRG
jgi:hypothetical protein